MATAKRDKSLKSVRPTAGPVEIILNDKKHVMRFDMNSLAELQQRFGSIEDAFASMGNGNLANIRTLLWASLIHEEVILDELTGEPLGYKIQPYTVGSWIMPMQLPEISEKLIQAIQDAMPDAEEVPTPAAQAAIANPKIATVVPTAEELAAQQAKN